MAAGPQHLARHAHSMRGRGQVPPAASDLLITGHWALEMEASLPRPAAAGVSCVDDAPLAAMRRARKARRPRPVCACRPRGSGWRRLRCVDLVAAVDDGSTAPCGARMSDGMDGWSRSIATACGDRPASRPRGAACCRRAHVSCAGSIATRPAEHVTVREIRLG